jgi:hypothetical protein
MNKEVLLAGKKMVDQGPLIYIFNGVWHLQKTKMLKHATYFHCYTHDNRTKTASHIIVLEVSHTVSYKTGTTSLQ